MPVYRLDDRLAFPDPSQAEDTGLVDHAMVKVCPILDWDEDAMQAHLREHDLPDETVYYDPTKVTGKRLVRVLAWYDNEWGFSCRMADVAVEMGKHL